MKVIVDIKGGIGNQLFCYAFGFSVAKKNGADLILDTSMLDRQIVKGRKYELDGFKIQYSDRISYPYYNNTVCKKTGLNRIIKKNAIGFGTKVYKEKSHYCFDENALSVSRNTYFDGFWQNYRYFDNYRDELLKELQIQSKKNAEILDLEKETGKEETVSMHIRRGDYIGLNWQLSMAYYEKSISQIKELIKPTEQDPIRMFVFTDDMEYAKGYFLSKQDRGVRYIFADYESENKNLFDLYLMSHCRHNIIANSSYSWWAAYTNPNRKKIVICPLKGVWGEDIYPDEWVKIEMND